MVQWMMVDVVALCIIVVDNVHVTKGGQLEAIAIG